MDDAIDEEAPTQIFARGVPSPAAPAAHADDPLWDANDVARYLKVSRSWVYQRAEAGLLACVRVGGLLRFRPESVRAIANEGAQPAKTTAGVAAGSKNR